MNYTLLLIIWFAGFLVFLENGIKDLLRMKDVYPKTMLIINLVIVFFLSVFWPIVTIWYFLLWLIGENK